MPSELVIESSFDRVDVGAFGSDHWSLLAYIDHVEVEYGCFQIGLDPRVRSSRVHYRLLYEYSKTHSSRHIGNGWKMAEPMLPKHGSRLAGGKVVESHDDWDCMEDLAAAGFISLKEGQGITLTEAGVAAANKIRQHKRDGGRFSTFKLAN